MLFSNELKYRIEVDFHGSSRPSLNTLSGRSGFLFVLFMLPFSTIWMWETWFFQGQLVVQLLLSFLLVMLAWKTVQFSKTAQPLVMSVSEYGLCRILSSGSSSPVYTASLFRSLIAEPRELLAFSWQITSRSRLLPNAIWLSLRSGRRAKSMWLFRDELHERDFRRLCVIVRYCQKHSPQKHVQGASGM